MQRHMHGYTQKYKEKAHKTENHNMDMKPVIKKETKATPDMDLWDKEYLQNCP